MTIPTGKVSAATAALACVLVGSAYAPSASGADAHPSIPDLITSLRLQEGSTPARNHKSWRVPKKLVAIGGLPPAVREQFLSAAPGLQIVLANDTASAAKAATDADIVLGLTSAGGICEPEIIDNAKELRWIHSMSAGVERCVAIPSVISRDLLVTNMRGVESAAIAETAIAYAMALARGLDTFVTNKNRGVWSRQDAAATEMQVLDGKTMLVVGLGGIGTEVASRAHALGMKVVATRNSGRTGPDYVSYVGLPSELLTLAKTADVIVNTAPLTTETTGVFNAKFFATLKPNAFFINVARGRSVVTADLMEALHAGRIAGAALDVVDPEPLPADHPLWKAPNLIITPHVSSASDLPREQRWILAREQIRRYTAGEKMLSVVDLKREY